MALLGATAVVLLNIGRLVSGVANLAVVPLREGLAVNRMKKPLRRVLEPVLTIGLVVLAFTFIPGLSRSGSVKKGTVAARLRAGVDALEEDMKAEVKKAGKARSRQTWRGGPEQAQSAQGASRRRTGPRGSARQARSRRAARELETPLTHVARRHLTVTSSTRPRPTTFREPLHGHVASPFAPRSGRRRRGVRARAHGPDPS